MRYAQWMALVICASAVSSCGAWAPSDPPPEALAAPCPAPVALPDRALSQAEVTILWRGDRDNLTDCGARLGLLAQWTLAR